MKVKTAKAAILAQSRKPLVVDEITLPEALTSARCWSRCFYTSICGAQINEIEAVKGPDKFLPHLLGHEASGHGARDRPRRQRTSRPAIPSCCTGGRARAFRGRRRPTGGMARSSTPAG